MKRKSKSLIILLLILISGALLYFGILQSVFNIHLQADCDDNGYLLNCNVLDSSVQVSDGYIVDIHSPYIGNYPNILQLFVKQDSSLSNILSKNTLISSRNNILILQTTDTSSRYSTTLSGCKANDCNGIVTGQEDNCNLYTATSSLPIWDLSGYRMWEDYNSGYLKGICDASKGTIVNKGGSFRDNIQQEKSPRYIQCSDIKSYCGGVIYKTNVEVNYAGSYADNNWGTVTVVPAKYSFSVDGYTNQLNNYTCSWEGTATNKNDNTLVKQFKIRGYTQASATSLTCIFPPEMPESFYDDGDYYINKDFTIDFTTKYMPMTPIITVPTPICTINPTTSDCASDTCIGSTCTDNCNNVYQGTKDCSVPPIVDDTSGYNYLTEAFICAPISINAQYKTLEECQNAHQNTPSQNCTEDILCQDGITIYAKCINGNYEVSSNACTSTKNKIPLFVWIILGSLSLILFIVIIAKFRK